jgi:membrane protein YdbS with pleckstrin-like domain
MHSAKNSNLTYRHISLFIWISWIFVILSLGLMSSWFLNFQIGFYIGVIALLFSLTYLIKNYIEHLFDYLVLESSCLTLNQGIIFKKKSQIPYYKINNIQLDKFLWIHNISFDTGNDTTNINFHSVARSDELKEEIENRIEQERHFEATGKIIEKPHFNSNPKENEYANLERQSRSPFQQLQPIPISRTPMQPQNPQRLAKPNIIDELERLNQLKLQGALSQVEFELAKKRLLMGG